MTTTVKAHTRRGHAVRAHTRQTQGSAVRDVLTRDRERMETTFRRTPECPHEGRFLVLPDPSDAGNRYRCQDCRGIFTQADMLEMKAQGKTFRPEQILRASEVDA